ncbi:MAG: NAD(P)-binding domain-containing protein [Hormoscilla sp. GM7CHS1pb]|nr:NAD(P)-binding domain-containing protein [Hormoscilla sp. GM7CHS1pb]
MPIAQRGAAIHFDLVRYIRFNQQVERAEKQDGWVVYTQDACYRSKYLIMCAGPYQKKRKEIVEIQGFCGHVAHIGDIKSIASDSYSEQDHVLVYGGGESASDVVDLLAGTPAKITWAIPIAQRGAAIRPALFPESQFFWQTGSGKIPGHRFGLR